MKNLNTTNIVRTIACASLLALAGTFVGCNTVEGAARDLSETGENIGKGVDRTGEALRGEDR